MTRERQHKPTNEKNSNRKPKMNIKMKKKALVFFSFILVFLLLLLGRIVYISLVSGQQYKKQVLDQHDYDSKTIPYKRGDILDRKGTVLATSTDVYNVILDCKVLNANPKRVDSTVQSLVKYFPDLKAENLYMILEEKKNSQYVVLLKKTSYESIKPLQELMKDKKTAEDIKGVWFEKEYIRFYPFDTLASSVLGFSTSGNLGVNGLENYYNSQLNGMNGREYGYFNTDNEYEITVKNAVNGNKVVTTIDATVQSIVEEKVKKFNDSLAGNVVEPKASTTVANPATVQTIKASKQLGSKNTGVVVMDPNSGEILAMANYPNFNLNKPRELTSFFQEAEIAQMEEKVKLDFLNHLWQNFCITYTYEPGSTVKPFTVATGLDTGKLQGTETYICDGSEVIGKHTIHCVKREGHGLETIKQALMNSCNDAMMQMAGTIGKDNFYKYQDTFGFGLKTNIDLPGEARTDSLVYHLKNASDVSLATNAFGQNFNATMIQVASGMSSLVNGGVYYQPHIVKEIQKSDGTVVENYEKTVVKQTVSKETSAYVKQCLYSVVQEGTGRSAKVDGYTMGGKTGTAQKLPREEERYLVSFIGHVPADNPKVLIYVVVDEPNVANQAQSSLATNLAKEIMTEILPYLNIYPDEGKKDMTQIKTYEENYAGSIFGN